MSLQTITPAIERESRLVRLVELIKKGKFEQARDYADDILKEGIPETSINQACYCYFDGLVRTNKRRAERLARVFQEYKWECWLK